MDVLPLGEEDEMGGTCSTNGREEEAYGLLAGKSEGRRPVGRPERTWLDNSRMDLLEVGWGEVDWIGLAEDRDRWRALVSSVLNLRVPQNAGKLWSVQTTRDLSSSSQLHGVRLVSTSIFRAEMCRLRI
jgi:hypothetical protein